MLLLLENTWLVDELRASRARIVDAADRERRRLERDLHDGAQQRLILLQIELVRAQERAKGTEVAAELQRIGDDAATALEELRVLAHGIYPTVLRELGLAEALRAQAAEAPIRVSVLDGGVGRCSPTIETAVYFCALEAMQNAAKHAGRDAHVAVRLDRRGDEIDFEIADDGMGFRAGLDTDGIGLSRCETESAPSAASSGSARRTGAASRSKAASRAHRCDRPRSSSTARDAT